ncbi:ABC transporter ATP-binding protein [Natrialba sp. INN-245]|uniref:ABC transporter ATP-binding protein n=1 Tax=Natrialba sp. INN-245 TaxID=2690967 RepID=UPI0013108EE2|nr:ABC transporter ATP-binding protein [Natrialba sp. INN-245]MWV39776.1 ATP-binding cassette domain-containing protein [Natrialba sp. INN-245]
MTGGINQDRILDEEAPIHLVDENALVQVRSLKKHFPIYSSFLRRKTGAVRAVDGVSFAIPQGETFGLVGESGSGKTTTGKTILRIEEPTDGSVVIDGQEVTDLSGNQLKSFRQQIQMVYQDPTSSLNPRRRVKDIIAEPLKIHGIGTAEDRHNRIAELLDIVGLPKEYMYRYPSSLSGGQKQRIGIARAVILNPTFIVLDEPTSALDVSVQARIVELFQDLQEEYNLTYLFISHDLSLVKNISDWIGIMYLGRLVEVGRTEEVFRNPQHPYTKALLSSIPTVLDEDEQMKPDRTRIDGEVPDPRDRPSGCAFRTRCPEAFDACDKAEPSFYQTGNNHVSRCFLHDTGCTDM